MFFFINKPLLFFTCVGFILTSSNLFSTMRLDYYYDQSEQYTKFSDWIPKRLHQRHPKNVEDFFLLYSMKQHYDTSSLKRNIYYLKIALRSKFRHPSQALAKITTKSEYHKYRLLIFMHIHLKIMRSYLRLGSLFDKRNLYFHNLQFAKELKESFGIAKQFYQQAIPYWGKAKKYASQASQYSFEIDLGNLESIRHEIMNEKINFKTYIDRHIRNVQKKLEKLNGKQKN